MKIVKAEIHNYRNLDGVTINFAEDCNFVVGENNLGKSNLIFLFNILFKSRSFRYEEFKDPTQPIEINLQLKLADIEIGHFEDLFDTDDYSIINITCKQIDTDDDIDFYHTETNTYIKPSVIRCINYVYYDSLRNPIAEINFDKGKGVGRFLNNIISQYLVDNNVTDKDFFKQAKVNSLIQAINGKISKIKSFKDFDISAMPDDDIESLLSKVVVLKDSKGQNLTKAGYGVQFIILVTLSILEKIQFIKQQRKERGVFEDEQNGTKSISLILGLDEPEIHLHPYMQRSLIKYLNSVINNQNEDFKQLIKELFDIDSFIGQIIVATHSPSIILDNYKQIVRFYKDGEDTKVLSGCQITLNAQLTKHLHLQFPFIKEAFFARCAIFVEGDSEYASFPHFGKTLSIEFDDLGICVIQARGDAIPQLIQIADKFGIPSVGITDKDNSTEPPTLSNHFQTTHQDFEVELISLLDSGKETVLRKIIISYDSKGDQREMFVGALNSNAFDKYKIVQERYTSNLKLADIPDADIVNLKSYYLTWFSINKSFPLGKLIGETLSEDEIPTIYQTVIKKAQEIAESD
jgi:putative ATP-dependent endonuclease of the OLD family